MIEHLALAPPLPPKMRRSTGVTIAPPDSPSATVLTGSNSQASAATAAQQVFSSYSFPEVHSSLSHITTSSTTGGHVVKIRINPTSNGAESDVNSAVDNRVAECVASQCKVSPCIRISVNNNHLENKEEDMLQRSTTMAESFMKTSTAANVVNSDHHQTSPYFFYTSFPNGIVMSSGQVSPSDTLDSGTCSDLDSTPPPLPKKKNVCVSVTVIGSGQHKRASSLTSSGAEVDSDDNESNLSCDSLNSGELNGLMSAGNDMCKPPSPPLLPDADFELATNKASAFLPQGLLQDIRERSAKLTISAPGSDAASSDDSAKDNLCEQLTVQTSLLTVAQTGSSALKVVSPCAHQPHRGPNLLVDESTYEQRKLVEQQRVAANVIYDTDCFYDFHLKEHEEEDDSCPALTTVGKAFSQTDESFAGYKDLLGGDGSSTIRSAKGTVRGVKNRVRAGIATFLQINSTIKSYKEKDAGKVVIYSTTMGIVRNTYQECVKVKQILRTLLVKFEERDMFMSTEYQSEIRDRMRCEHILVPQVFVDGQHVGDGETIERLNETGELRRMLKPYKSMDACTTCKACGGYRLLPCPVCNGSKKSVHRNHFTTEFVALKCMNCDEVGLVKCSSCSS